MVRILYWECGKSTKHKLESQSMIQPRGRFFGGPFPDGPEAGGTWKFNSLHLGEGNQNLASIGLSKTESGRHLLIQHTKIWITVESIPIFLINIPTVIFHLLPLLSVEWTLFQFAREFDSDSSWTSFIIRNLFLTFFSSAHWTPSMTNAYNINGNRRPILPKWKLLSVAREFD